MQIILPAFICLDGVVQAPGGLTRTPTAASPTAAGRCRTSTRRPWGGDVARSWRAPKRCSSAAAPGRAWPPPGRGRAGDPFADRMNAITKYVASRTLTVDDLTWSGSTLLPADDAIGAIRELRARDGGGLQILGSAVARRRSWSRTTSSTSTVLMIAPILLGGGKRIFPADGSARPLELVSSRTASTGAMVCTYRPRRVVSAESEPVAVLRRGGHARTLHTPAQRPPRQPTARRHRGRHARIRRRRRRRGLHPHLWEGVEVEAGPQRARV